MGNKFKLSDMMPNAWFYKLRDMSRSRKRNSSKGVKKNKVTSPTTSTSTSQMSQQRYSNFFAIEPHRAGKLYLYNSPIHSKHSEIPFTDSPRRSSKRRSRRKAIYKPSPKVISPIESSSESNLHEYATSDSENDKFTVPDHFPNGLASDCSCRISSSTNDIIIDMKNESFTEKLDEFDTISQLGLAPIFTKPVKFNDDYKVIESTHEFIRSTKLDELKTHQLKEKNRRTKRERKTSPISRVSSANSTGIRLRVNSPKLANKKVQGYARKSVSCKDSSLSADFPEGFAVVKSSFDPQRDFKESMVEMIMENNIRESKDLENLLACYLSLNSGEYHELIVKAFEQIWYDRAQLKM